MLSRGTGSGIGLGLSSTPASFWPIQNTCLPKVNVQFSESPVAPRPPSLHTLISEVTVSLSGAQACSQGRESGAGVLS